MHEQLLTTILSNTYTKTDLYRRIGTLKEFLEHTFYDTDTPTEKNQLKRFLAHTKEQDISPSIANAVAAWGDDFFNAFSADTFYDVLQEIMARVEAMPEITLYVPVMFSPEQIAGVGAWCRENLGENLLLDVKVDPAATGGCIIAWGGVYHDFSLSYFLKKRERDVMKLVQSYGSE